MDSSLFEFPVNEELTRVEIASKWRSMDQEIRKITDSTIKVGKSRVAVVRFFRDYLGLTLEQAWDLYADRQLVLTSQTDS